jgi:hypothetical protein
VQVLSSGNFMIQWMGPCFAASEIISKDFLFSKTSSAQPVIVDVENDRASATQSFVQEVPRLWTAGIPMTFALSVRDKFGNTIDSHNDELELVDVLRTFSHVRVFASNYGLFSHVCTVCRIGI